MGKLSCTSLLSHTKPAQSHFLHSLVSLQSPQLAQLSAGARQRCWTWCGGTARALPLDVHPLGWTALRAQLPRLPKAGRAVQRGQALLRNPGEMFCSQKPKAASAQDVAALDRGWVIQPSVPQHSLRAAGISWRDSPGCGKLHIPIPVPQGCRIPTGLGAWICTPALCSNPGRA